MGVWILSSELASEVAGGIARYVNNFGRLLGTAGHEAVLLARSSHPFEEEVTPGFRVIGIAPAGYPVACPWPSRFLAPDFMKRLNTKEPSSSLIFPDMKIPGLSICPRGLAGKRCTPSKLGQKSCDWGKMRHMQ